MDPFYEFLCYIAIGFLAAIVPRRMLPLAVAAGFMLCTLFTCIYLFSGVDLQKLP